MKIRNLVYILAVLLVTACGDDKSLSADSVESDRSQKYADVITERYLREEFVFAENEKLKQSQCEKKNYLTCTYIWGATSKRDARRTERGLGPEGNKLIVIYAQTSSPKDFQRVLASYSDAEKIDGLGLEAIWSDKRKQLSLMTDSNLIVHINIDPDRDSESVSDPKAHAVSIANTVLKKT